MSTIKYCDCSNLLEAVVTSTPYHECTVCKKQHDFKEGDTLIRGPAVKPEGLNKNMHIIKHMEYYNAFPFVKMDCKKCGYASGVKYVILDDVSYYKCPKCHQYFQ